MNNKGEKFAAVMVFGILWTVIGGYYADQSSALGSGMSITLGVSMAIMAYFIVNME